MAATAESSLLMLWQGTKLRSLGLAGDTSVVVGRLYVCCVPGLCRIFTPKKSCAHV